jgi:cysteine desulfurase family protein
MGISQITNAEEAQARYLDNAATTFPKPECVYVEADSFYRNCGGNAGRGGNPLAQQCARLLADTRLQLARWLGAPRADSVVFTASATEALNLALLGTTLRPGDVIYVTPFEHNSVLRPVEHLRQTRGVEVRQIPFSRQTYACQMDQLAGSFAAEPPAIVCVTHASNVCGLMPPVEEIATLAKQANPGAVVVVDGAQVAGLYPLPLGKGLIDAYIFSGHKALYGPYGIAGLVLGPKWRPEQLLYGGTGTVSESLDMPDDLPTAYETGSHNMWAVAGLHAALEWLKGTGRQAIVDHSAALGKQLRECLQDVSGVDIYAPPPGAPSCGIVSIAFCDVRPQDVEAALGGRGIAVRAGLHCAPWAHKWLGTLQEGGTVRISPGWFTTSQTIAEFVQSVRGFV